MSEDSRSLGRITSYSEVLAVIICSVLLATFLAPAIFRDPGVRSNKQKCANNLKGIGIALILYSNDYRFFPHLGPEAGENSERDVSKIYRQLVHLKYIDQPEVFICPSSEDLMMDFGMVKEGQESRWSWRKDAANADEKSRYAGADWDPGVMQNHELSYTYLRKKMSASAAAGRHILAADKAHIDSYEEAQPPNTAGLNEPVGNHRDGFNILYADCHVEFHRSDDDSEMQRLVGALHMGHYSPRTE